MIDPNTRVPGFFLVLFPDHGLNHVRAVLSGPISAGQLGLNDGGRSTAELAEVYGFTGSLLNQFLEAHLIQRWAGKTWLPNNDYRIFAKGNAHQDVLWNLAGQLLIHGMLQEMGLKPPSE